MVVVAININGQKIEVKRERNGPENLIEFVSLGQTNGLIDCNNFWVGSESLL